MRIVVSDSSCLSDLRKVSLLDTFLQLPHEFLIPNTLFEEELVSFTATQKNALLDGGLKVIDLPGTWVLRAQEVIRSIPQLSVHDGFAFALAEMHPGSILLTGDTALHVLASRNAVKVQGLLWAFDEMYRNCLATPTVLLAALHKFAANPTVRLPLEEVTACIKRYQGLKHSSPVAP